VNTDREIAGYVYKADFYCSDCVTKVMEQGSGSAVDQERYLDYIAAGEGIDRQNEYSFDSDIFPKVVLGDNIDFGDRCGWCGLVL
jgi:hypothetical protein